MPLVQVNGIERCSHERGSREPLLLIIGVAGTSLRQDPVRPALATGERGAAVRDSRDVLGLSVLIEPPTRPGSPGNFFIDAGGGATSTYGKGLPPGSSANRSSPARRGSSQRPPPPRAPTTGRAGPARAPDAATVGRRRGHGRVRAGAGPPLLLPQPGRAGPGGSLRGGGLLRAQNLIAGAPQRIGRKWYWHVNEGIDGEIFGSRCA